MIFLHEPVVEKTQTEEHGMMLLTDDDQDEDDEEDTLSFCEFSINSDSDSWVNSSSSSSSQNSSFKSSNEEEEEDSFEFFSHELGIKGGSCLPPSSNYPPPENIIFCGKLISYKQPTSENTDPNVENIKLRKHRRNNKRGILRWKWKNFSSPHNIKTPSKSVGLDQKKEYSSSQVVPGSYKSLTAKTESASEQRSIARNNQEKDKMPLFTVSTPSKWYLLFFGVTKYNPKMDLRELRFRQSRSGSSSSLHKEQSAPACINRSNGFWAVLRALSCGNAGTGAAAIVRPSNMAAAGGCIPSINVKH
ncbi:OLC1v1026018C1 [Oldenlandia corymbosa var. corymbosa]|uniref:OLC1v1026018C1 n=1 Tax=Oldenlandia corymbosa var. corymbosa TaxID=529605 RepID=A0AAV1C612_OLDCO|nr:OLC1v1026018C1 [Oldenlandia corymbosa var. corymbosa]